MNFRRNAFYSTGIHNIMIMLMYTLYLLFVYFPFFCLSNAFEQMFSSTDQVILNICYMERKKSTYNKNINIKKKTYIYNLKRVILIPSHIVIKLLSAKKNPHIYLSQLCILLYIA